MNGKTVKVLRKFALACNRDLGKLKAFYQALPQVKRHQLLAECERAIYQIELNTQRKKEEARRKRLQDFAKVLEI